MLTTFTVLMVVSVIFAIANVMISSIFRYGEMPSIFKIIFALPFFFQFSLGWFFLSLTWIIYADVWIYQLWGLWWLLGAIVLEIIMVRLWVRRPSA